MDLIALGRTHLGPWLEAVLHGVHGSVVRSSAGVVLLVIAVAGLVLLNDATHRLGLR